MRFWHDVKGGIGGCNASGEYNLKTFLLILGSEWTSDLSFDAIRIHTYPEMTHSPTGKPTASPSDSPTYKPTSPTMSPSFSPTTTTRAPITPQPTISFPPTRAPMIPADDPRHSYWCGNDWADAALCHEPCISGMDTDCPGRWLSLFVWNVSSSTFSQQIFLLLLNYSSLL